MARALAALPGDEPRVVVPGNFATPHELLGILERTRERVRAFVLNPQAGWPRRPGFITETPFVGPGARDDPALDYLPMRLSLVPRLFEVARPPDAVFLHTSVPRDGYVSLGVEVNILPAALDRARARGGLVVAQVNRHMPHTGGDALVPVEDIDLALAVDRPLPSPAPHPPGAAADAIGELVAGYATDGGTVQLGIGQIPDAAARHLGRRRGLGVWTEMFSDGVVALERTGALDPSRPLTATFLFGSPDLYAWADDNSRLVMRRTEVVNDPARIAAHPAMLSVNCALQLDLFAQANASHVGSRLYSGLGGQPDFVVGALHSDGGHAVIALHAWHDKTDTSTVLPQLVGPVTTFQHSVVVTEHGAAEIFGHGEAAQTRLLIDRVADPRARDPLRAAATGLGLLSGP